MFQEGGCWDERIVSGRVEAKAFDGATLAGWVLT